MLLFFSPDALDEVYSRLLGSFSLRSVVEPMNYKLSDAIMEFQENGLKISERVGARTHPQTDTFIYFVFRALMFWIKAFQLRLRELGLSSK